MPNERWAWDVRAHPRVARAVTEPTVGLAWCGQLEIAANDAVVGKILCVCGAVAIARAILEAKPSVDKQVREALDLVSNWIDNPTDERFDRIHQLTFGEEAPPDPDPHGVVWWALRTATCSVGNYEAGWALESACDAAVRAGFRPEQLRMLVEQELFSRAV